MRRAFTVLGVAAFGIAAFFLGLSLADRGGGTPPEPALSVVDEVRAELASRYYRPVPREVLALGSVDSMLAALDDPYTEYLDPSAYRLLRHETARSYSGIGVTVLPTKNALVVTAVYAGPGKEAGIRVGDRIVAVGGVSTAGLPFEEALERILGPEGSALAMRLRRQGKTLRLSVVRRRIEAPVVSSRLLAVRHRRRVGYVRLAAFRAGAAQVLRAELQRLERARASALVLDLRNNPGGLLDQAVSVASLFLDKGVVVSVESANHHGEVFEAKQGAATRLRLVVLVDRTSASAAEVVAAALHDHHRATLVGENTYGKALVQTVAPLSNGAALRMTTARYRTPAGIDISRRGIKPDVLAVDDTGTPADEALAAALLELQE
jgi:carboxyl-terminal processing protease